MGKEADKIQAERDWHRQEAERFKAEADAIREPRPVWLGSSMTEAQSAEWSRIHDERNRRDFLRGLQREHESNAQKLHGNLVKLWRSEQATLHQRQALRCPRTFQAHQLQALEDIRDALHTIAEVMPS